APTNDIISGQGLRETVERVLDPSRHATVAIAFGQGAVLFGSWSRFFYVPLIMLLYLLLSYDSAERRFGAAFAIPAVTLLTMVLGYYFVYITTPHDLAWHLQSSLDRLFMQLWPSFVFTFFMLCIPWWKQQRTNSDSQLPS